MININYKLHKYVAKKNLSGVKDCLANGADINDWQNSANWVTPLMIAVKKLDIEMIKFLLDNGALINGRDDVNANNALDYLKFAINSNTETQQKVLVVADLLLKHMEITPTAIFNIKFFLENSIEKNCNKEFAQTLLAKINSELAFANGKKNKSF